MKMSVKKIILIVIIAVIADRSYRIKKMFDVFPSQYNDANCKLKGEMMGNEDMALGKYSVLFIGSSGNLDQCFKHGSASAQPGGIYILDIKEGQKAEPQQIFVQNSPYTAMHAHGIYVSNKTDRLYVVDHLGPKSVIQIMKIVYNKPCLESKGWSCTDPVSLLYIKTISSHLFPRYGINDVAEGINESEIYVTRWLPFPVPEFGAEGWSTLLEKMNPILNSIFVLLGIPGTLVYRCNVDKGECEAATDRIFIGSNGITISDDRTTVYVADPTRKQIALMKRSDSGFLTLESWIYLPYGVDNLELDSQSGEILMGTIPSFPAAIAKMNDEGYPVPGGLSVLKKSRNGDWETQELLQHDGTKLSQISQGARFGETVVLGSPFSQGILVCTVE